jgi:hypothetical protein
MWVRYTTTTDEPNSRENHRVAWRMKKKKKKKRKTIQREKNRI